MVKTLLFAQVVLDEDSGLAQTFLGCPFPRCVRSYSATSPDELDLFVKQISPSQSVPAITKIAASWRSGRNGMSPSEMIQQLIERTARDFRSMGQLRTSPDGEWLDGPLALNAVQVFGRYPNRSFLDLDLALCYFLIRSSVDVIVDHFPMLGLTPREISLHSSLISLIASKSGGRLHFPQTDPSPSSKAFSVLGDVTTGFTTRASETWLRLRQFISDFHDKTRSVGVKIVAQLKSVMPAGRATRQRLNAKMWRRLWTSAAIQKAPWHSIDGEVESPRLKRSSILGPHRVPFRVLPIAFAVPPASCRSETSLAILDKLSAEFATDFAAEIIGVDGEFATYFGIRDSSLRFRRKDSTLCRIPFSAISEILLRTRFQQPTAIDIYLKHSKSILVNFPDRNSVDILWQLHRLMRSASSIVVQTRPNPEFLSSLDSTAQWASRRISNFAYISALNRVSGRSFNDVTQYPIFPSILSSYSETACDLEDPLTFRDFKQPQSGAVPSSYFLSSGDVATFLSLLSPFCELASGTFSSVQSITSSSKQIIPEFYHLPEFLASASLPPWANKSAIEFVYRHRMALETEFVSRQLHEWVNLTWGVRRAEFGLQNSGAEPDLSPLADGPNEAVCIPDQLFFSPHPERLPLVRPKSLYERSIVHALSVEPIMFADIRYRQNQLYTVVLVDVSGSVLRIDLDAAKLEDAQLLSPGRARSKRFSRDSRAEADDFPTTRAGISCFPDLAGTVPRFDITGDHLLIVDGSSHSLAIVEVSSGSSTSIGFGRDCLKCVACDGGIVAVGGKDSVVSVFDIDEMDQPVGISLYRGEITCCAVSQTFGMVAAGTSDGFLVLSCLKRFVPYQVIEVGRVPQLVMISQSWGFVVVYGRRQSGEGALTLYSVNGLFVRERVLARQVLAWTTWSSVSGFDYLLIATDDGCLSYSELFFLDFQPVSGAVLGSTVRAVRFGSDDQAIVAMTESGDLSVFPFVVQ
jgi:hypothetical protein